MRSEYGVVAGYVTLAIWQPRIDEWAVYYFADEMEAREFNALNGQRIASRSMADILRSASA